MNLFQYAIASVIDANTGYRLSNNPGASVSSTAGASRASTHGNLLQRLLRITNAVRLYFRQRREVRRNLHDLARLNDHALEDIGFSRGDISALQGGQIDLAGLEARRFNHLGERRIERLRRVDRVIHPAPRNALNDATFARAKCA